MNDEVGESTLALIKNAWLEADLFERMTAIVLVSIITPGFLLVAGFLWYLLLQAILW